MYVDLGSALNAGVQSYYNAKDRQQQLNQQQQLFELAKQLKQQQLQQNEQMMPLQAKQAQLKLQALEEALEQQRRQNVKQRVFQYLDAYREGDGDTNVLNYALKNDPDFKGLFPNAVRIEPLNNEDIEMLKKTGKDPNKFRYIKVIEPDGDIDYMDLSTIYAASGYTKWATKNKIQDLQAKLLQQKLDMGGINPTSEDLHLAQWANLYKKAEQVGGYKNLPPEEQALYIAYNRKYGPPSPTDLDKRVNYASEGTQVGDIVYKAIKNPLILQDVLKDDDKYNQLFTQGMQYQIATGKFMPSDTKRNYIESLSFLNQAYNILKDLKDVKPESLYKGPIDEWKLKVETLLSDDKWNSMSPEEKRKALLSITLNGKLGLLIKQYVKATSGLAASDREFDIIKNIITAGAYSNIPALKQSVKTFFDVLDNDLTKKLEVDSRLYPGDVLSIIKPYRHLISPNIQSNDGQQNNQSNRPSLDEIFK